MIKNEWQTCVFGTSVVYLVLGVIIGKTGVARWVASETDKATFEWVDCDE